MANESKFYEFNPIFHYITFQYLVPKSSLTGIKADLVVSLSYIYFNEQDNKKRYRERAGEKHQKHLKSIHKR